ncbi:MAG: DNA polymerase III, subunit gamma and tau [Candidatus Dojkabacteria bacterium]|nr:MAG: DNA polymerase III, subunit gamma and tau [Candidatus Dojkabacteria bacterium]
MSVVYRKYRPQTFSDVLGQDHVVKILKEAIKQDKLSHAYLFSGPRGTGKTTMARLLAKAVNCVNFHENEDVCNECSVCLEVNSGSALDVIEMDAASNRGIEEIRTLKDGINFAPNSFNKKIYIIDEAHMLTKDAFNALLKTLEEPPNHVLFVLATTEAHKLPITILSRVQRFDFRLADKAKVIEKLTKIFAQEGLDVEEQVYEIIYNHSKGSFRDAESLVGKILSSAGGQMISKDYVFEVLGLVPEDIVRKFLNSLIEKNHEKALEIIENVNSQGQNVSVFIDQVLSYLEELLIEGRVNRGVLIKISKLLIQAKLDMKYLNDKLFPLKVAIFELTQNSGNLTNLVESSVERKNEPRVKKEKKIEEIKQNEEPDQNNRVGDLRQILLQSEKLPMIIKTQLQTTKITNKNGKIEIECEEEIVNFLDKADKKNLLLSALKEHGFGEIDIIFRVLENNLDQEEDNSDLVESIIL